MFDGLVPFGAYFSEKLYPNEYKRKENNQNPRRVATRRN